MTPNTPVIIKRPDGHNEGSHPLPFDNQHVYLQVVPPAFGWGAGQARLLATVKPQITQVEARRSDQGAHLTINGVEYFVQLDTRDALHVITGPGDDEVKIVSEHDGLIVIETGAGNDLVYGSTNTKPGTLVVNTGAGDDRIGLGGLGVATLYGGEGNDFIGVALEHATVFAGSGDDTIVSQGPTIVDATLGSNHVEGTPGRDVIYASTGTQLKSNAVDGETFADPRAPAGAKAIYVEGSDAYHALIEQNLELLRSTATGLQMLRSLDASGARVTIEETIMLDNASCTPDTNAGDPSISNGKAGRKVNSRIRFNPLMLIADFPTVVTLYHELCHAWNFAYGTALPDPENQAVGLPTPDRFEFDNDPHTPLSNTNPDPFNENALRRELGLPRRNVY